MTQLIVNNVNKYDNYITAGDLNINMFDPKCDRNCHFSDLKDTYNLLNLVKSATCFKSSKGTLLDVLLTNKPKSFRKTFVCETGLSDCHKFNCHNFQNDIYQITSKGYKIQKQQKL